MSTNRTAVMIHKSPWLTTLNTDTHNVDIWRHVGTVPAIRLNTGIEDNRNAVLVTNFRMELSTELMSGGLGRDPSSTSANARSVRKSQGRSNVWFWNRQLQTGNLNLIWWRTGGDSKIDNPQSESTRISHEGQSDNWLLNSWSYKAEIWWNDAGAQSRQIAYRVDPNILWANLISDFWTVGGRKLKSDGQVGNLHLM